MKRLLTLACLCLALNLTPAAQAAAPAEFAAHRGEIHSVFFKYLNATLLQIKPEQTKEALDKLRYDLNLTFPLLDTYETLGLQITGTQSSSRPMIKTSTQGILLNEKASELELDKLESALNTVFLYFVKEVNEAQLTCGFIDEINQLLQKKNLNYLYYYGCKKTDKKDCNLFQNEVKLFQRTKKIEEYQNLCNPSFEALDTSYKPEPFPYLQQDSANELKYDVQKRQQLLLSMRKIVETSVNQNTSESAKFLNRQRLLYSKELYDELRLSLYPDLDSNNLDENYKQPVLSKVLNFISGNLDFYIQNEHAAEMALGAQFHTYGYFLTPSYEQIRRITDQQSENRSKGSTVSLVLGAACDFAIKTKLPYALSLCVGDISLNFMGMFYAMFVSNGEDRFYLNLADSDEFKVDDFVFFLAGMISNPIDAKTRFNIAKMRRDLATNRYKERMELKKLVTNLQNLINETDWVDSSFLIKDPVYKEQAKKLVENGLKYGKSSKWDSLPYNTALTHLGFKVVNKEDFAMIDIKLESSTFSFILEKKSRNSLKNNTHFLFALAEAQNFVKETKNLGLKTPSKVMIVINPSSQPIEQGPKTLGFSHRNNYHKSEYALIAQLFKTKKSTNDILPHEFGHLIFDENLAPIIKFSTNDVISTPIEEAFAFISSYYFVLNKKSSLASHKLVSFKQAIATWNIQDEIGFKKFADEFVNMNDHQKGYYIFERFHAKALTCETTKNKKACLTYLYQEVIKLYSKLGNAELTGHSEIDVFNLILSLRNDIDALQYVE